MATNDNRHVIAVADPAALATVAAERVLARIADNSGRVAICLTGGSSPKQLYQLLASDAYRDKIPWQRVHWFIGDERFVPATDPLNNMAMARAIFLDRYAPAANIHPIPTATADPADPDRSAALYEQELKSFYGADALDPARPLFDLVLMGVGPDGHTASLFPGDAALDETVALGRRRAQSECRTFRAAGYPHAPHPRLLPRNAVRGGGLGQARDLDAAARGREPPRQPRAIHRRDDLARGQISASGEFSWVVKRLARWW